MALGDHTYGYYHQQAPQSLATTCLIIATLLTMLYVGAERFVWIVGIVTSYVSNTLGLLWFVLLKVTIRLWYGFRELHHVIRKLSHLVVVVASSKFFRREILTFSFIRIVSYTLPISSFRKSMLTLLLDFISILNRDSSFFDRTFFAYNLLMFIIRNKTTLDLVINDQ